MKSVSPAANKLVDLFNAISSHDAQLVAVTETWLNDAVTEIETLPARFVVHRKDRCCTDPGKRGGGLLLGVDQSIPSKRRTDLEAPCEIMVCELTNPSNPKVAVVLCYRPPQSDKRMFISNLHDVLFNVLKEFTFVTVLGDFNFPDLDWVRDVHNSVSPESEFFHLMLSFFLKQVNTVPSNAHQHFLDLIFSNSDGLIQNISDAHVDYDSDHIVLYFDMFLDPPKNAAVNEKSIITRKLTSITLIAF